MKLEKKLNQSRDIQVEPSAVIQSLTRQIAEQAGKIAMLEAYIAQLDSEPTQNPEE
jgi:hypothetical protein